MIHQPQKLRAIKFMAAVLAWGLIAAQFVTAAAIVATIVLVARWIIG